MRGCQSPRRLGLEHAEGLEELLGGHAIFGVARVVHDAVGELEQAAWIKAAADRLGDGPRNALKEPDVADVVKVDDGTQLVGELKVAAGVSLDENMMSCPVIPSERAIMSSV